MTRRAAAKAEAAALGPRPLPGGERPHQPHPGGGPRDLALRTRAWLRSFPLARARVKVKAKATIRAKGKGRASSSGRGRCGRSRSLQAAGGAWVWLRGPEG